jgi:hypothetical protein
MAAHRKSDRHHDDLCEDRLRKAQFSGRAMKRFGAESLISLVPELFDELLHDHFVFFFVHGMMLLLT